VPLIVSIVLVHIGGLCASTLPAFAAVAAMAVVLSFGVHGARSRAAVGAALFVIAGLGAARRLLADRALDGCIVGRQARDAVVWLEEAVRPGVAAAGEWRWGQCRQRIYLRVVAGEAAEGDAVRIEGDILRSARAFRVPDARVTRLGESSRRLRVRARLHTVLDSAFGGGEASAFARALVTGDASRISAESRDRWAASGLVHLISVSGLHIAIVIDVVAWLLRQLHVRRARAEVASLVLIGVYLWILGTPAPALRAAVTAALLIVARRIDRPTNPWAIWALACAAPLVNPHAPLDVGYQLSALGAASLVVAGVIERRTPRRAADPRLPRVPRWRRDLKYATRRALVVSVCASIVTMPITLWTFGRVSVIAPLTNLIGGPLMTVAQPALFLVALTAPLPALSRSIATAVRVVLGLTDGIADAASRVPLASVGLRPSLLTLLMLSAMVALGVWALIGSSVRRRERLARAVVMGGLVAWAPLVPLDRPRCGLHAIDVGQGDGLALRTSAGRWVVVDAGPAWTGGDAGQRAMLPYLARFGGVIALVMLSHADLDHAGGVASILTARAPPLLWDPGYRAESPHYRTMLDVASRSTRWHRAREGDSVRVDDLLLEVLAPGDEWLSRSRSTNDASLIVRATCVATTDRPAVRFLLMGDAEAGQEDALVITKGDALRADVLKVPHHGSRTSSTEALLEAVSPKQAVISVGADNRYGHPSPIVLARYAERGVVVARTDQAGSIVVEAGPDGPVIVRP
jgi:competence protein ComEC